jgi:hypothetical protein
MMDEPEPRLFSAAGLAVLDGMVFDPAARAQFEHLSGGLMWPDELPRLGSTAWTAIAPGCLYRFVLAYRASITLHPEQAQPFELWEQVVQHAPNWPGLRRERRGERALRRLRAAHRQRDKCYAELDTGSGNG